MDLPHHPIDNGGLLGAHYWFNGGQVDIVDIETEHWIYQQSAIVVSTEDNEWVIGEAAFDTAAMGCEIYRAELHSTIFKCPKSVGPLRSLKVSEVMEKGGEGIVPLPDFISFYRGSLQLVFSVLTFQMLSVLLTF